MRTSSNQPTLFLTLLLGAVIFSSIMAHNHNHNGSKNEGKLPSLSPPQSICGVKSEPDGLPPTIALSSPSAAPPPQLPIIVPPVLPTLPRPIPPLPTVPIHSPRVGKPQSIYRKWMIPHVIDDARSGPDKFKKANVKFYQCPACGHKPLSSAHINDIKRHIRLCASFPQCHKGICGSFCIFVSLLLLFILVPDTVPAYNAPVPVPSYHAPVPVPLYHAPHTVPLYHVPRTVPSYRAPRTVPSYHAPQTVSSYHAPHTVPSCDETSDLYTLHDCLMPQILSVHSDHVLFVLILHRLFKESRTSKC